MADYDDLHTLTGKLKRAAIDAYMKDEGFRIDGEDQYYDERHSVSDLHYKVSRPGSDGEGGGDWTSDHFLPDSWLGGDDKDAAWRAAFAGIRDRVDAALEPWQHNALPKPTTIDSDIEQARQAMRLLSTAASSSGGSTTGGGEIAGYLRTIDNNSNQLSGSSMEIFKAKFLYQLEAAVSGYRGIALVLGNAHGANKKIWEDARQGVADVVDKSTKALDAHAKSNDVSFDIPLLVAGAAVAGAKAFITGGATVALEGAAVGLTLLSGLAGNAEKKAKEPASTDYDGLMTAFEGALGDLSDAIGDEETQVKTNLETNFGQLEADRTSYDLTAAVTEDGDGNPRNETTLFDVTDDSQVNVIVYERPLVNGIIDVAMPGIATELYDAADQLCYAAQTRLTRAGGVGLDSSAVSGAIWDLGWRGCELAKDLEWEVRNGAKMLQLVIDDLDQVDAQGRDALSRMQTELAGGSGWTPFG